MAVLACIAFVLDGLAIATSLVETHAAEHRLEHEHQVIEHLQHIESGAQVLGSYVRRYVGDGSLTSLQDYYAAEASLQSILEALGPMIADSHMKRLYLAGLKDLVNQRIAWEREVLSIYKSEGQEKALQFIQARGSAPVMEKIRSQLSTMVGSESNLIEKDRRDYDNYKSASLVAILLLTLSGGITLWQAIKMSSRTAHLESDQVLAYEQLEQMNKQLNKQISELLKAQKDANEALKVRSQFLARVSHELRTPLASIIGSTELALTKPLEDEARQLLEAAKHNGELLLTIVNDILDFEKLEQNKLQIESAAFDLPLAIKSALEPLKMKSKLKGIAFDLLINSEVPNLVYGDRLRMQQVLVNLTDNAVKFTEQGKVSVTVAAERKQLTRVEIRFTISDSGIGIDSETLNYIFDPFNQVDESNSRRYSGPGLGLTISKRLVELLNGKIELKSTLGSGSEVFFQIPVELREDASPEPIYQPQAVVKDSASILVVDDNSTICRVSEAQLKTLGYGVRLAMTGKQAVELTAKEHFDLILMDMQMPDMDGVQTAKKIRSAPDNLCRDVPIIAYTAHAMPGDEEKFLAAGLSDYLAKPVLLDAMRKSIEKWIVVQNGLT
jgi:signal transduction histidine kinase/ActR/RegA family two-component response regulator